MSLHCCLQLVLPVDVNFLVSNSLDVPEHNQQLLEMVSAGAAVVIPAWEPTAVGDAGQQAAIDLVTGMLPPSTAYHAKHAACIH